MTMVFCRGCGGQIHETAPTCPHCGAPQVLNTNTSGAPRSSNPAIGWIVVIGLAALLVLIGSLAEKIQGIPNAAAEWIVVFIGIALICLAWMFISTEKRQKFVQGGQVDLNLFWAELRSTFGAGVMWFFILAAGVVGSLIATSLFRTGA